mmetsp:Transcript_56343/g.182980  ORF Transcript_56343/g.182980 Transcript_56343/m.182980 type:complete len:397 (-) Transcript_56343:4171-5361(-)
MPGPAPDMTRAWKACSKVAESLCLAHSKLAPACATFTSQACIFACHCATSCSGNAPAGNSASASHNSSTLCAPNKAMRACSAAMLLSLYRCSKGAKSSDVQHSRAARRAAPNSSTSATTADCNLPSTSERLLSFASLCCNHRSAWSIQRDARDMPRARSSACFTAAQFMSFKALDNSRTADSSISTCFSKLMPLINSCSGKLSAALICCSKADAFAATSSELACIASSTASQASRTRQPANLVAAQEKSGCSWSTPASHASTKALSNSTVATAEPASSVLQARRRVRAASHLACLSISWITLRAFCKASMMVGLRLFTFSAACTARRTTSTPLVGATRTASSNALTMVACLTKRLTCLMRSSSRGTVDSFINFSAAFASLRAIAASICSRVDSSKS